MKPKALIFDVFGTCVDWRSSVARDVAKIYPEIDANDFALKWRAEYIPSMARIRSGERGYVALDTLHKENLERVLEREGLAPMNMAWLVKTWERLDPWPDVIPALDRLHADYILAPCSNGSIGLMTRLARYASLPWDCILGAELAQNYKPHPSVYQACLSALRLNADEVMMVAAHNGDLRAAREQGLLTGFVRRATEYGPEQTEDLAPQEDWEICAEDFSELARALA